MIRMFDRHNIRSVKELDGMWSFTPDNGSGKTYSLPVPGCWEQHPDLLTYRGTGTFTRTVRVTKNTAVRLVFKGVSHTADVYFDGQKVAHHYNAFTPFTAEIPAVKAGEHELTVKVDNRFSEASALHIPNDYYTYGGITRPAALEEIDDLFIERIHFTPEQTDSGWKATVELTVRNVGAAAAELDAQAELAGVTLRFPQETVPAGGKTTVSTEADFPDVSAWSPDAPNLYFLRAVLRRGETETDDLIERVGFRVVSWQGGRLCVNGNQVFLKGFNRHEDYASVGCAIPVQLMAQDLDLMADMGANAVRTCHYPNDERFLDLCDERGFLVWEENHARGLKLHDMQNPNFERQCEDCIREMIENHYNHPAIVIWGILNECASDTPEGRVMYQKQFEQIKSLDTTRPTTTATCQHFKDLCLDLPDVVSFNIYSGWYSDVSIPEAFDREIEWIRQDGGAGKPLIVSEFGAAAVYGYRDPGHVKWSEERQSDVLDECLSVYMNNPQISGTFIWMFADCRVCEENNWFSTRARGHNNKGVVDEYRRPKIAYQTVKNHYKKG